MRTVEALCVRDWSVTAENGDYFEVRRGETYTTSLPNQAPSIGPEPKAGHVIVFSNYWVQVPVDVFSFPEGTDEELTDEDMEDSTENVLGLKDQIFGLEHLIREKDEEIDQLKKLLARSWRYDEATDCFIRPLREND